MCCCEKKITFQFVHYFLSIANNLKHKIIQSSELYMNKTVANADEAVKIFVTE